MFLVYIIQKMFLCCLYIYVQCVCVCMLIVTKKLSALSAGIPSPKMINK